MSSQTSRPIVEHGDHARAGAAVVRGDDTLAQVSGDRKQALVAEERDVCAELKVAVGGRAVDDAAQLDSGEYKLQTSTSGIQ